MRGYVPPVNEQERMLQRKVADAIKAVCHTGMPKYIGFLNTRETELAKAEINRQKWAGVRFEGGRPQAERLMLCVFEQDSEIAFPMEEVFIRLSPGQPGQTLTHRDYLGALLGCGVKRERIGDIHLIEDGAVTFLHSKMTPYLQQNLTSVGRCTASIQLGNKVELPQQEPEKTLKRASVASLRLDAVLAAMLQVSRGDATSLINKDVVQINHLAVQSLHHSVYEGDVFSIRGVGKYKLETIGGQSRKNRTFIEFLQY